MKQGFSTLLLIIIIVAVGLIGAGAGYYYGANNTTSTTSLITAVKISTPKVTTTTVGATATAVDMANWKTYTNTNYGFSLKYPNDWKVQDETDLAQSAWDNNEKLRFIVTDGCKANECQQVGFYVHKNGVMENSFDDYKIGDKIGLASISDKQWTKILAPKSKRTCIGNGCIPNDEYLLYTTNNNETYTITYNYISESNQQIVDQILSTFQFAK